jgi:hypothetical protein
MLNELKQVATSYFIYLYYYYCIFITMQFVWNWRHLLPRFKKSASTLTDTLLRTQTQYIPSEFANIHSRSWASTFEKTDTPRD